jgi:ectoine hydroxylase-related dioxygenase (phytanoyl-CoA dioxygenase family)
MSNVMHAGTHSNTGRSLLTSCEQAEVLERDGAVLVKGLLDSGWRHELVGLFDTLVAQGQDLSDYYGEEDSKQRGAGKGRTVVCECSWRREPKFLEFLQQSPLAQAAAELMQSPTIALYEDLLIFKSAGAEQPTPWHQDEPQWPVSGRQMVSAWFCLDPVTPATGALKFAAGTHRGPMYRPFAPPDRAADLAADDRFFEGGPLPDVDGANGRFAIRSYEVQPGDVLFFHPRVLHAALGSAPTHARRTFSIRFLGGDVRWLPKQSVFHDWLKQVELRKGDPVIGERFPPLWPRRPAITA